MVQKPFNFTLLRENDAVEKPGDLTIANVMDPGDAISIIKEIIKTRNKKSP